jgi:hypothetical protein
MTWMRRRAGMSGFLLLAVVAIVFVRAEAATEGPDAHTQPLLDGCQRSDSLQLAVSTPEWVYVHTNDVRMARLTGDETLGRRTMEGVVSESRPAGEDLYLNHDFSDYNVLVRPDTAYEDLLGSGNHQPGREQDIVEGEWEVSQVPFWAWPSRGDHVRASGNWIWDCGHWGNSAADPTGLSQLLIYDPIETIQDVASPGAIRGESTELHPLHELATYRSDAAGILGRYGPRVLSQLDVWINGDGGQAQSAEECALRGINNAVASRVVCPTARDVAGTYTYTLKLRPKPSRRSRLIVNPVVQRPETRPELAATPVEITSDPTGGTVRVKFTLPHEHVPQAFGLSVTAGWSDDLKAVQHEVTLHTIHIVRSLDGASEPNLNPAGAPGEQASDPGEWVLYANVSGNWVQIPGIAQAIDNFDVPIEITRTFYLPPGLTPRLYVSGHECDEPLLDCVHEGPGAQPPSLVGSLELGFNDRPGRIQDNRLGVLLQPGVAQYHPSANPDPGSGNEDLSDAVCGPVGCYVLTVEWTTG